MQIIKPHIHGDSNFEILALDFCYGVLKPKPSWPNLVSLCDGEDHGSTLFRDLRLGVMYFAKGIHITERLLTIFISINITFAL